MTLTYRSTLLLGTAFVAAMAGTTADAQAQQKSTFLSPLTIASGEGDGIGDPYADPKAESTVSADEIAQFGGKNADDVLRVQPGTFTRDSPQNPGIAVNIRGLEGSGRVNMSIDGARQNFRFTGHEAQGFTYVDPALLGGIDVQRGGVAGAGGAGALAGVANFRTLVVDDLITDEKNFGGFASVTAGTNGAGFSESGAAAFRVNDTFAILGALSKRSPENYSNGAGEEVPFTAQDIISGLGKVEITPSEDLKITLSGLFFHDEFAANSYHQTVTNQTYTARLDYTPFDNELIDLHALIYKNETNMEYGDPIVASPAYSAVGREIDVNTWGLSLYNTSRGNVGDVGIEATYGFEFASDDVDVLNSKIIDTDGVNPSGKGSIASIFSTTTASLGIVDLTGGLRYDYYTAEGRAGYNPLSDNPFDIPVGGMDVDRADGRLNPSVTLALNPTDWLQPYVSYTESMRAPTVNELFAGGEHPSVPMPGGDPGIQIANPTLEPEIAKTVEVGANFRFDGVINPDDSLRIKANYFHSSIDNYITSNIIPHFIPPTTFYYEAFFANNPGTSTVQGVELQAAYDAGAYFGGLSYTHTSTDLPPQDGLGAVSFLPDHIFSLTAGLRLLEDQSLTVGGRVTAVSDSSHDAPSGESIEGYALVDLFGNYKLENGIELGLNISNVFDAEYTPALSYTPSSGGIDTGRGRTIEFTAKATF